MDRRDFLRVGAALTATGMLPQIATAKAEATPAMLPEDDWRTFDIVLSTDIPPAADSIKVWLPLSSLHQAAWIKPMGEIWQGNASDAYVVTDDIYGARMLYAEWPAGEPARFQVKSRFAARDRLIDFDNPGETAALSDSERALYTKATHLLPTDGIVRETAERITQGARGDLAKAKAIYDWVVDNTFRDPKVRGCGIGDIRFMLKTGNLSGKCADLNALYVGLARSVGLPARDVYGVRVAESRMGFRSLGKGGDISKAQHCRAEVFLDDFGWVAIDPADVRKVALEEPPGNLAFDSLPVSKARGLLFGGWETNWLAYNVAHDVHLPNSDGPQIGFFMYPQAEVDGHRLDSLDPAGFRYRIQSSEISA